MRAVPRLPPPSSSLGHLPQCSHPILPVPHPPDLGPPAQPISHLHFRPYFHCLRAPPTPASCISSCPIFISDLVCLHFLRWDLCLSLPGCSSFRLPLFCLPLCPLWVPVAMGRSSVLSSSGQPLPAQLLPSVPWSVCSLHATPPPGSFCPPTCCCSGPTGESGEGRVGTARVSGSM